ncbi:hypothetical protein ACK12G_25670 [Mycolicibacterium wolinskyi]|uniref:hypothetical protein n=1 Tax=Mycolicibacterium wolinskyi TaxID=59750 RepID=UPI0039179D5D
MAAWIREGGRFDDLEQFRVLGAGDRLSFGCVQEDALEQRLVEVATEISGRLCVRGSALADELQHLIDHGRVVDGSGVE